MKKLSGIVLVICLIIPFIGAFSVFHFMRYKIRKEIKCQMIRGMSRNDLVVVKVAKGVEKTELRWVHSSEFEFAGHMYDVVDRVVNSDSISYYCWPDHVETRLNRQLSALIIQAMGQNPQNRAHQQRLADFFKSLFSSRVSNKDIYIQVVEKKISHPQYQMIYPSFRFPPPSPPPEAG